MLSNLYNTFHVPFECILEKVNITKINDKIQKNILKKLYRQKFSTRIVSYDTLTNTTKKTRIICQKVFLETIKIKTRTENSV